MYLIYKVTCKSVKVRINGSMVRYYSDSNMHQLECLGAVTYTVCEARGSF